MFQNEVSMDACPSDICSHIVCDEQDGEKDWKVPKTEAVGGCLSLNGGEMVWVLLKRCSFNNIIPPYCPESLR